jgi:hypothetical protein
MLVRRLMPGDGSSVHASASATPAAGLRAIQLVSAAAASAALGPGVVASHTTAARIHMLDALEQPGRIVLSRAPGRNRSGRTEFHIHSVQLPASHVTNVLDVAVTTVARTVIDIARTAPFRDAVVVADSALRAKKTSMDELMRVLADCRGWPGARQARRVVEFADGNSESALESIGRVAFDEFGLPAPELQAWVGGDDVVGRADFYWPRHATIAEADGLMKYADDPQRKIAAQIRRDDRLRGAGFEIVHFTWEEITRNPQEVVDRVQTAFSRAERERERERERG